MVYFYFSYVDPWGVQPRPLEDLVVFVVVTATIVVVGGPVASALSFLVAEYYSRRDVPLFFPAGRIERSGVLRVPILVRLGATFFITSVLPPLLMMMVSLSLMRRFGGELPEEVRP